MGVVAAWNWCVIVSAAGVLGVVDCQIQLGCRIGSLARGPVRFAGKTQYSHVWSKFGS